MEAVIGVGVALLAFVVGFGLGRHDRQWKCIECYREQVMDGALVRKAEELEP